MDESSDIRNASKSLLDMFEDEKKEINIVTNTEIELKPSNSSIDIDPERSREVPESPESSEINLDIPETADKDESDHPEVGELTKIAVEYREVIEDELCTALELVHMGFDDLVDEAYLPDLHDCLNRSEMSVEEQRLLETRPIGIEPVSIIMGATAVMGLATATITLLTMLAPIAKDLAVKAGGKLRPITAQLLSKTVRAIKEAGPTLPQQIRGILTPIEEYAQALDVPSASGLVDRASSVVDQFVRSPVGNIVGGSDVAYQPADQYSYYQQVPVNFMAMGAPALPTRPLPSVPKPLPSVPKTNPAARVVVPPTVVDNPSSKLVRGLSKINGITKALATAENVGKAIDAVTAVSHAGASLLGNFSSNQPGVNTQNLNLGMTYTPMSSQVQQYIVYLEMQNAQLKQQLMAGQGISQQPNMIPITGYQQSQISIPSSIVHANIRTQMTSPKHREHYMDDRVTEVEEEKYGKIIESLQSSLSSIAESLKSTETTKAKPVRVKKYTDINVW